jgi:hypothetical protein
MSESTDALVPDSKEAKEVDAQGESKQPELDKHKEADPKSKDGQGELNQPKLEEVKEADHNHEGQGELKQLELEDHKIADYGESGSAEFKQPESEDHKLAEPEGKITGDKGKEYPHHDQAPYRAHYHKHFPHTMEKLEDIKEKLKEFNARCHKIHGKK